MINTFQPNAQRKRHVSESALQMVSQNESNPPARFGPIHTGRKQANVLTNPFDFACVQCEQSCCQQQQVLFVHILRLHVHADGASLWRQTPPTRHGVC